MHEFDTETSKSVHHRHAQMRFFAEELNKCENTREVNKKMQAQISQQNNQHGHPVKDNSMKEWETQMRAYMVLWLIRQLELTQQRSHFSFA